MGRGDIEAIGQSEEIAGGDILLYNYVPASNRHFSNQRGLHQEILDDDFPAFLAEHDGFVAEAAEYEVTLGMLFWHPWGRGGNGVDDYQPLPNGDYTTQRLDQILKAEEAGYTWITDGVRNNCDPDKTILYIGSTPVMSLDDAGFTPLIEDGFGFAFDAATTYDEDSEMFQACVALAETNETLVEANRVDQGLPLAAFVKLWSRQNRVPIEDAPSRSAWWWRSAANDGDWDIDKAAFALLNGLILWVQLNNLTESERNELYEIVAEYSTTATITSMIIEIDEDQPNDGACSGAILAQTCVTKAILEATIWPRFPFERFSRSTIGLFQGDGSGNRPHFISGDATEPTVPGPVPQLWVQQGIGFHGGYSGFGGGFIGGGSGNRHGPFGSTEGFGINAE